MPFRGEREASRARIEQLEQELAEAKRELASRDGLPPSPTDSKPRSLRWIVLASLLVAIGLFGAGFVLWRSGAPAQGSVLGVAGIAALTAAIIGLVLSRLLVVVPPVSLGILSGRAHRAADGSVVGYRLVRGGRVLRIPLLERLDMLDLTSHLLAFTIGPCYSREGSPLAVEVVAIAKITARAPEVHNAVGRFLGVRREQVALVARDTLEGAVRSTVARLTLPELRGDPLRVAEMIHETAAPDFARLGLELDTVKLKRVDAA